MNHSVRHPPRHPLRSPLSPAVRAALATVLAVCTAAPTLAAGKAESAWAAARYRQELAACNDGQTNQARPTCITEAKAAYAAAKRGMLPDGAAVDPANASKRCDVQRGDDRTACLARMHGQGVTSGSPAQGGVLRELVTREPAASTGPVITPPEVKAEPTPTR